MGDARQLLDHLHRGGAWAYYWTPDGEPFTGKDGKEHRAKVSVWYPVGRRCAIPAAWADKNVYWAVHPCTAIPPTNALGQERRAHQVRAQLPYVAAINCLFAEYDGCAAAALQHLDELWRNGLPYPSAIIHSGGGLHCYWLLEDTVPVTDSNRAQLAHLQAAWVDLVGADDGAKDLARVLRVPGTQNRKPRRQLPDGSFPKVTVLEYRPMRMYDLADLAAPLPPYKLPPPEPKRSGETAGGAADYLLQWAVSHASTGSRHSMALWLAGRLKAEGLAKWAAQSVLEDFARQVSTAGTRQLDAAEMRNVIGYVWGSA